MRWLHFCKFSRLENLLLTWWVGDSIFSVVWSNEEWDKRSHYYCELVRRVIHNIDRGWFDASVAGCWFIQKFLPDGWNVVDLLGLHLEFYLFVYTCSNKVLHVHFTRRIVVFAIQYVSSVIYILVFLVTVLYQRPPSPWKAERSSWVAGEVMLRVV